MRARLTALPTGRALLLAGALAAAIGLLTVTVPLLRNVGLLIACTALLAVIAVVAQWLWQAQARIDWSNEASEQSRHRGSDQRINALHLHLEHAEQGDTASGRFVHDLLGSLADERLRHRQGVSRADDPDRAQSLLGPELTAYLSGPPPSRLTAAQAATLITRLEEL